MEIYTKMFISFLTDSLDYLVYLNMFKNNNLNLDTLNDNELFEQYVENNLENIIILLNEILNKSQIKYSIWNKQFQPMLNEKLYIYKEYYDFEYKSSRMFRINDNKEITDMKERINIMQDCVNEKNHVNIDLISFLRTENFDSIEDIRNYFISQIYSDVKFPIYNNLEDNNLEENYVLSILSLNNTDLYIDNSKYWSEDTWKIIENSS